MADDLSPPTAEALIRRNRDLMAAAIETQLTTRSVIEMAVALRCETREIRRQVEKRREWWSGRPGRHSF